MAAMSASRNAIALGTLLLRPLRRCRWHCTARPQRWLKPNCTRSPSGGPKGDRQTGHHRLARPWRYGVCDYLIAVDAASERTSLQGFEVEAAWDSLSPSMRQQNVFISQESVVDRLLPELTK